VATLVIGIAFTIRDFRNAWPMLLPGLFFLSNEFIRVFLHQAKLIPALTQSVGTQSQSIVFVVSFLLMLAVLIALTWRSGDNTLNKIA
jgi:uncharacterized membrane protein YraQ (UPF0718 family)